MRKLIFFAAAAFVWPAVAQQETKPVDEVIGLPWRAPEPTVTAAVEKLGGKRLTDDFETLRYAGGKFDRFQVKEWNFSVDSAKKFWSVNIYLEPEGSLAETFKAAQELFTRMFGKPDGVEEGKSIRWDRENSKGDFVTAAVEIDHEEGRKEDLVWLLIELPPPE